jgi:hypothetical protein
MLFYTVFFERKKRNGEILAIKKGLKRSVIRQDASSITLLFNNKLYKSMKKLSFLVMICSFFAATSVFGQQWNGANNSTSSIYRNGNVGLGMPYPTSQLHIHGISSNATFALESTAGKYVISTNIQGYFD